MKSIKDIYKIGFGPSSSHTMGPSKAAIDYKTKFPSQKYKVVLYDSLAKTGKGHLTDCAIAKAIAPSEAEIVFDKVSEAPHPNTMDFFTVDENGNASNKMRYFSVGGGDITCES